MRPTLCFLALFAITSAYAQLEWSNTILEFRPEYGTEEVEGDYVFKNVGDVPITITRIKPSCGCTTIELAKKVYKPGESGVIRASMTIDKRGGTRSKTILVETEPEDAEPQRQVLIIRSEMERLIDAKPRFVFWRNGEEPTAKVIEVTVDPDKKMAVTEVVVPGDAFKAELKTLKPHAHYQVVITPNDTSNAVYAHFTIKAKSPEMGIFDLKCYAKILNPPTDSN